MTEKFFSPLLMQVFLTITGFPAFFSGVLSILVILVAVFDFGSLRTLDMWLSLSGDASVIAFLASAVRAFLLLPRSEWWDRERVSRQVKFFFLGMPVVAHVVFVCNVFIFIWEGINFLKFRWDRGLFP